jgi:hypothetical protein
MEEVKKWKLFGADLGVDSAREVRECFIPGFSKWKGNDSYQAALRRLVGDLKTVGSGYWIVARKSVSFDFGGQGRLRSG